MIGRVEASSEKELISRAAALKTSMATHAEDIQQANKDKRRVAGQINTSIMNLKERMKVWGDDVGRAKKMQEQLNHYVRKLREYTEMLDLTRNKEEIDAATSTLLSLPKLLALRKLLQI